MRFSSTASLALFAVSANALPLRSANSDFVSRAVARDALREEVQPKHVAVSQEFVVRDLDQTKVAKGLAQSNDLGQPKVAKRLRIFESDSPTKEQDYVATGPTQADSGILQRSILNEDVLPPHPVAVSQDLPKVAKRLRISENDSPTEKQDYVATGPTQADSGILQRSTLDEKDASPPNPVAVSQDLPKVAKRLRISENDSPTEKQDFVATGPTQADSDILRRSTLDEKYVPPPHPVAVSQDLAALDLDQPKVAKRLRIFESDSPTDEQGFVASGPAQAKERVVASGDPPSPVAV